MGHRFPNMAGLSVLSRFHNEPVLILTGFQMDHRLLAGFAALDGTAKVQYGRDLSEELKEYVQNSGVDRLIFHFIITFSK
jgi:hypothetical protein